MAPAKVKFCKMDKVKFKKQKIAAVGMSGGVDSAVAALLLKQQGLEVVGVTMKIWKGKNNPKIAHNVCFGPGEINDIRAAKRAAKILGIKHKVIDLSGEYRRYVLDYYKKERLAGRTPNPCVECNQKIKFGFLAANAAAAGIQFDYFATGHYARKIYDPSRRRRLLLRGVDLKKDQSYFLYRLNQTQLRRALFPLGEMTKDKVKEIARASGLAEFAQKKESRDFIAPENGARFLPAAKRPGDIADMAGNIVGAHEGYFNFTVGQRRGLRIGGLAAPVYVADIDACKNRVIVGEKNEARTDNFEVGKLRWIAFGKLQKSLRVRVRVRSSGEMVSCLVVPQDGGRVLVKLDEPQFAIAPGQSAVFYDNDIVLGGGVIVCAGFRRGKRRGNSSPE
jgi:tRNA-specific 2-thiouridylase